jgi:hypothetical protein
MQRVLTPNEVTVTTASAEVRIITLNGKQLTQAVFRQLPEVYPLAWGEDERGEPLPYLREGVALWGRVNYHWKDCDLIEDSRRLYRDHQHVVLVMNGELAQASIDSHEAWRVVPSSAPVRWYENKAWLDFYHRTIMALPQLYIAV